MTSQPHPKARMLPVLKHIQLTHPLRRDYSPAETLAATTLPYHPCPSPGLLLIL